jgi:hypothetical protein
MRPRRGNRKALAPDPFSSVTDVTWNPETDTSIAAVFAAPAAAAASK